MTSIAETLAPLVSSGQWGEAANSLDLFELDHGHTPGWPFALQLLGHAFSNDLPAAKLAFKRVPAAAKGDPEVAAAWAVVRALLDADGDALSAALRTRSFSPDAARAAAAVAGEHRRRTLLLLSSAHSTISLAEAASTLALPPPEALVSLSSAGWTKLDGPGEWLAAPPPPPGGVDPTADDVVNLQRLVEIAQRLS